MFSTLCSRISKPKTVDNAETSFPPVSRAVLTQTHYFLLVKVKKQFSQKDGRWRVYGFTLNQTFHTEGLILFLAP